MTALYVVMTVVALVGVAAVVMGLLAVVRLFR